MRGAFRWLREPHAFESDKREGREHECRKCTGLAQMRVHSKESIELQQQIDQLKEKLFDAEWRVLANEGYCDNIHGGEYDRVKLEWKRAGKPVEISAYIQRRANVVPKYKRP